MVRFCLGSLGSLMAMGGVIVILPSIARADFFVHSWKNQYENNGIWGLSLDSNYYASNSNFQSAGNLSAVSSAQNYSRIYEDLALSVGLFDGVSVFGRFSWSFVNQVSLSNSGIGFGLNDQSVGLTLRLLGNQEAASAHLDLQVQADVPVYSNASTASSNLPYLGDGSVDITGGGFLSIPLLSVATGLWAQVGGGFTYRTLGFSSAIPWRAALQYYPETRGLFGSVSSYGMFSLGTDQSVNRTNVGIGTSLISGAVNPSLMILGGRFGYKTSEHFELSFGAAQSLWGQNAPNGYQFDLCIKFQLGAKRSLHAQESTLTYGYSNRGFLNYSLDAHVLKSNDRLNLVKIDKGGEDGVEVGQVFDIFRTTPDGTVVKAIARGEVTHTKSHESALQITEFFEEVPIDGGFSAKRLISKEAE